MAVLAVDEMTEVMERVREWSPEHRLVLAQSILHSLRGDLAPTDRPRKSLRSLVGLLEVEGPPPTDDECDKILEEERLRKYG